MASSGSKTSEPVCPSTPTAKERPIAPPDVREDRRRAMALRRERLVEEMAEEGFGNLPRRLFDDDEGDQVNQEGHGDIA
jgi:hypothetical protein